MDKSVCLKVYAQVGRSCGGTSPPKDRHVSGLVTRYCGFDGVIYAIWRKLCPEDAIEQWERNIGDRLQHVGVIMQFSLSPMAECGKQAEQISFDSGH